MVVGVCASCARDVSSVLSDQQPQREPVDRWVWRDLPLAVNLDKDSYTLWVRDPSSLHNRLGYGGGGSTSYRHLG